MIHEFVNGFIPQGESYSEDSHVNNEERRGVIHTEAYRTQSRVYEETYEKFKQVYASELAEGQFALRLVLMDLRTFERMSFQFNQCYYADRGNQIGSERTDVIFK
ncbi:hypothetical protein BHYA_0168g00150 [Botrytis hyacinthi]|uniref:Uncharacterized protein n=1 Tax=Botrytis hyacinthi TaxID=278943 RepID=A0A4Z1GJ18_9HELO|nr:hypothetical protein BHYA_0168g00150 [Botrytis hyacinthi]